MARAKAAGVNKSQEVRSYLSEHPDAGPKEVRSALAERGITISEGLVSNIKYAKNGEASAKPTRRKVKKRASSRASGKMTKSQAVREYLKKNPSATARDVVPALKQQGMEVSEGLVSVIRSNIAKKPGGAATGGGRGKRAGGRVSTKAAASTGGGRRAAGATGGGLSADDLFKAKQFVDGLGGVAVARRALDTLEQLR